jgi:protein-S-isoprenylcysteine O-methyltransferase Ste14
MTDMLLPRALFAFLALPGMVAFFLPWLLHPPREPMSPFGIPVFALGIVGLLLCVRDFYVTGKGTLAPWSPPKNLVAVGLYRWSRNPMYVSVLTILLGWALLYPGRILWAYLLTVAVGFHLRVMLNEEPYLARTHGEAWTAYRARVRRWF